MPDYSPAWYEATHDVIYTFHMPLFMFASGFIYMATKRNVPYGQFLWKKVKRLMVPYLSVSAIVITIKLLTEGHAYVQNPVTAMSYVKMFYLPEAGYFLWFIWALWWMFVLVPLFKNKNVRLGLFVVAAVLHYVLRVLARSVLPKTVSAHADILHAGRGMLRLEGAAYFYEECADMEYIGMLRSL